VPPVCTDGDGGMCRRYMQSVYEFSVARNRCRLSQSNGNGFRYNHWHRSRYTLRFPTDCVKIPVAGIWCGAARCTDGDGGCAAVTCNRCMSFCCRNRCRLSQSNGNGFPVQPLASVTVYTTVPTDCVKIPVPVIWCGAARCTDGDGGCAAVTCNRCMSFCCRNRCRLKSE